MKKSMDHTQLLVLTLLAAEEMYGYQIITELEKRSDHTFAMKEGTLYPVLHGLWKDGAVEWKRCSPPFLPWGDGHDGGGIFGPGGKMSVQGHL